MLELIQNVVTGIAAAVVTMLVGYYLVGGREPEPASAPDAGSPPVLRLFARKSGAYSLVFSLLFALATSLAAALIAGIAVAVGANDLRAPNDVLAFANDNAWPQLSWAVWNYLVWGALSWFVVAFARRSLTPDPRVFATAGLLGGIHHIMANLGIHFIGRLVLGNMTVPELYALHPAALTRMWLPYFLESVTAGILVAYYLTLASNRPIAHGLYRLRYKILTVLLVVLGLNYPAVLAVEEGSFVRAALAFRNTGIVWWGCLGAGVSGLTLGTFVYDLGLRRMLQIHPEWRLGSTPGSPSSRRAHGEAIQSPQEAGGPNPIRFATSPWDFLTRSIQEKRAEVRKAVFEGREDSRGPEEHVEAERAPMDEAGPGISDNQRRTRSAGSLLGIVLLALAGGASVGLISRRSQPSTETSWEDVEGSGNGVS